MGLCHGGVPNGAQVRRMANLPNAWRKRDAQPNPSCERPLYDGQTRGAEPCNVFGRMADPREGQGTDESAGKKGNEGDGRATHYGGAMHSLPKPLGGTRREATKDHHEEK